MSIYDDNGVYVHEWLFGTDLEDIIFINKSDRHLVTGGNVGTSLEDIKAVDMKALCKSLDIPVTLTNFNIVAYNMDNLVYKE